MNTQRLSVLVIGLAAAFATTASAQITGFGGNGSGWSLQGYGFTPTVTLDNLHLTNGYGQATSAFNTTQQTITDFTASYTLTNFTTYDGWNPGDGLVFTLQRSGAGAIGGGGGYLGYLGIPNATGLAYNLWVYGGVGTGLANTSVPYNYQSVAPVNLLANHPIDVSVSYNGTTKVLSQTLTDSISLTSYSASYNIDIANTIGGNTAYVGFTGGTGGAYADQHVSNFTFNQRTTQTVPDTGSTFALFGLAIAGLAAARRKRLFS